MRRLPLFLLLLLALLPVACRETSAPPEAPPTLHPGFGDVAATRAPQATRTPLPSPTPRPTPTPDPRETVIVTLFGGRLLSDWTLENSEAAEIETTDDITRDGASTLRVNPQIDFARLRMTVRPDAQRIYYRDQVVGFRFWLFSGSQLIETDDILVTVTGSNEVPYWMPDDTSVEGLDDELPVFSATRLYFLGFNRDIPPQTWVQVEVVLDDLIQDPLYEYVTGLVISNGEDILDPFFIGDVEIMLLVPAGS